MMIQLASLSFIVSPKHIFENVHEESARALLERQLQNFHTNGTISSGHVFLMYLVNPKKQVLPGEPFNFRSASRCTSQLVRTEAPLPKKVLQPVWSFRVLVDKLHGNHANAVFSAAILLEWLRNPGPSWVHANLGCSVRAFTDHHASVPIMATVPRDCRCELPGLHQINARPQASLLRGGPRLKAYVLLSSLGFTKASNWRSPSNPQKMQGIRHKERQLG